MWRLIGAEQNKFERGRLRADRLIGNKAAIPNGPAGHPEESDLASGRTEKAGGQRIEAPVVRKRFYAHQPIVARTDHQLHIVPRHFSG